MVNSCDAAMKPKSPWLFGPTSDLTWGAGLLTLPLSGILPLVLAPLGSYGTILIQWAAALCNYPHYAATVVRLLTQSGGLRRHGQAMLSITSVALAAWLGCLWNPVWLTPFFTLYLLWSPYHYAGQNYGISLLFLKRRQVTVASDSARWFRLGFHSSTLIAWLFIQQDRSLHGQIYQLPLPIEWLQRLTLMLLCIQFMCWGMAGLQWFHVPKPAANTDDGKVEGNLSPDVFSRGEKERALRSPELWWLPTLSLMMVQCWWFSIFAISLWFPASKWLPHRLGLAEVAFMHCAQYLWIYLAYQRISPSPGAGSVDSNPLSAPSPGSIPQSSKGHLWLEWLRVVFVGAAMWLGAPWLLSRGFGIDWNHAVLSTTVFINLHHFWIDGLIWKLKDPAVGSRLGLGATLPTAENASPAVTAIRPDLHPQRSLARSWKFALAGAMAVSLFSLDSAFRWKLAQGSAGLTQALRLNPNHSALQTSYGIVLLQQGKGESAHPHLVLATALDPANAVAWHNLGLQQASSNPLNAIQSFLRALQLRPELTESRQSVEILLPTLSASDLQRIQPELNSVGISSRGADGILNRP